VIKKKELTEKIRKSRSDFEENTHQEVERNSDDDKSPATKDINVVINVDNIPVDKKRMRRGLSKQDDKSIENAVIKVHTVDQEGPVNEKQNKEETEKDKTQQEDDEGDNDEVSKIEDHEQEENEEERSAAKEEKSQRSEEDIEETEQEQQEQEQEQEGEQEQKEAQEEEEVECPPAHRDRSRAEDIPQGQEAQAQKTEEAQEEEYFENSNSDRERSRNTEKGARNSEEQPRRASNKRNEDSGHEKSEKPQKPVRSEVVLEESLNHSNVGAGKNNHTQDVVLTLNEFLDKSAERPNDTEDANGSAFGFLAAVTRRDK